MPVREFKSSDFLRRKNNASNFFGKDMSHKRLVFLLRPVYFLSDTDTFLPFGTT